MTYKIFIVFIALIILTTTSGLAFAQDSTPTWADIQAHFKKKQKQWDSEDRAKERKSAERAAEREDERNSNFAYDNPFKSERVAKEDPYNVPSLNREDRRKTMDRGKSLELDNTGRTRPKTSEEIMQYQLSPY